MTPLGMTALLAQLTAGWENEVVEFKEADGYSTDKIGVV